MVNMQPGGQGGQQWYPRLPEGYVGNPTQSMAGCDIAGHMGLECLDAWARDDGYDMQGFSPRQGMLGYDMQGFSPQQGMVGYDMQGFSPEQGMIGYDMQGFSPEQGMSVYGMQGFSPDQEM